MIVSDAQQSNSVIHIHVSILDHASLVAQMVKRLPAMRETQVQSLGWESPLEKEMAIHSSILAWKISWMEEPGRLILDHKCFKKKKATVKLWFVVSYMDSETS